MATPPQTFAYFHVINRQFLEFVLKKLIVLRYIMSCPILHQNNRNQCKCARHSKTHPKVWEENYCNCAKCQSQRKTNEKCAGFAWVTQTPDGWQIEFIDTPTRSLPNDRVMMEARTLEPIRCSTCNSLKDDYQERSCYRCSNLSNRGSHKSCNICNNYEPRCTCSECYPDNYMNPNDKLYYKYNRPVDEAYSVDDISEVHREPSLVDMYHSDSKY